MIVTVLIWFSSALVALRAAAAVAEAESVKERVERVDGLKYTEVVVGVTSRRMRLVMVVDIWMCQVMSVM